MTAHFYRVIQDQQGNVVSSATVTVCPPGLNTTITETLYADAALTVAKSNPFVTTNGEIDFYLVAPKTVALLIAFGTSVLSQDNVDVLPSAENLLSTPTPLVITSNPEPGQVLTATSEQTLAWATPAAPSSSGTPDTTTPSPPTAVTPSATAYADALGYVFDQVTLTWNAPTTNTNTTALTDLDHYEVQYKIGSGAWTASTIVVAGTTTAFFNALQTGQLITFRVQAVDGSGHHSGWANSSQSALPTLSNTISQPDTPALIPLFRGLLVTWDGRTAASGFYDANWVRAEVHCSTTTGFTPSLATLSGIFTSPGGGVTLSNLSPDSTYYVVLLCYDRSGNVSIPSAQASGVPARITGTNDIVAGSVTADLLATLALYAQKIYAGSVQSGDFFGQITGMAPVYDSDGVTLLTGPTTLSGDGTNLVIDGAQIICDNSGGQLLLYLDTSTYTVVTLSVSGSWTPPTGCTSVKAECWGAGGGGRQGGAVHGGGGGGGGEYARNNAVPVTPGTACTVGVGQGGTGGVSGGAAPTSGGDTTFTSSLGGVVKASGGKAGTTTSGGAGGNASTAPTHYKGGAGGANTGTASALGGAGGGSSAWSTAAGLVGGATSTDGGLGGDAPATSGGGDGGKGADANTNASATAGSIPGGGGGAGGGQASLPNAGESGQPGGRGQIKLTYTTGAQISLVAAISPAAGTDPVTGTAYPAGASFYGIPVTDWNAATKPGFYSSSAASNSPNNNSSPFSGYVFGRPNGTAVTQLLTRITNTDVVEVWVRPYASTGTWGTWRPLFYDTGLITSGVVNAVTSQAINLQQFRKSGPMVQMRVDLTVPAITSSSSTGDTANTTIATIADTRFIPAMHVPWTSGVSGRGTFGYIDASGNVILTATAEGANFAAGDALTVLSTYMAPV